MTNSTYRYPPDEFDVAVPGGAPVGVHRAPRSGWSSAWPFLLVALVCAGVAWGGITLLSGGGDSGEPAAQPNTTASASVNAEPSGSPDGSEGEGEGDGENADDGGGEDGEGDDAQDDESSSDAEYPGDPSLANKSDTVIGVYNNGGDGMDNMAGTGATNLQAEGFTGTITPANTGDPDAPAPDSVSANTVLYSGDRADTASAVAQALGIEPANVQQSEDVAAHPTEGIWVILVTPLG